MRYDHNLWGKPRISKMNTDMSLFTFSFQWYHPSSSVIILILRLLSGVTTVCPEKEHSPK